MPQRDNHMGQWFPKFSRSWLLLGSLLVMWPAGWKMRGRRFEREPSPHSLLRCQWFLYFAGRGVEREPTLLSLEEVAAPVCHRTGPTSPLWALQPGTHCCSTIQICAIFPSGDGGADGPNISWPPGSHCKPQPTVWDTLDKRIRSLLDVGNPLVE